MPDTTLWYVGQFEGGGFGSAVWDFQGVFDTEAKAEAACVGPRYFLAPVILNRELPEETVENPGSRWAGYEKLTPDEQRQAWPAIFGTDTCEGPAECRSSSTS